jgi:arsenite methyltransferase
MATAAETLASVGRLGELVRSAGADAQAAKACCAAAYGIDVVRLFLGESYHPGGAPLTRRLAQLVQLRPTQRVLDVASGIGTSALVLAAEYGVDVLGVDLGERQVALARARAEVAGLAGRVRFEVGDAERLLLDDGNFDATICECAFCTFPDKASAAAELVRVISPGGRLGIADVWLDPKALDAELGGLAGRVACLADARPIDQLCGLVARAGGEVVEVERHDEALLGTITQVRDRLRALRLVDLPLLRRFDLRRGVELAERAAELVRSGSAGYVLIAAKKPLSTR